MISLVTNIDSLVAQQNLNVNSQFQSNTIQQLTSGYRINSSADDAAGLAVANGYRNQIAQLNQGVLNGNQGVSQLQIIDGGLSNISEILDRMQTLATESASSTFAGNRATLNNEYASLMSEIDRQAANIGLGSGGQYNTLLSTYIGGGNSQTNSQVSVDLSGSGNVVDSTGLGLAGTSLLAGGVDVGTVNLNASSAFLANSETQVVTLNLADGDQHQVTITGSASGITAQDAINQINQAFSSYGVTASIDSSTGYI
jgi:flagellin